MRSGWNSLGDVTARAPSFAEVRHLPSASTVLGSNAAMNANDLCPNVKGTKTAS